MVMISSSLTPAVHLLTHFCCHVSEFGEYNPGGGKDEVLKYLNEAEIQVKLAEKALKTILDCVTSTAA